MFAEAFAKNQPHCSWALGRGPQPRSHTSHTASQRANTNCSLGRDLQRRAHNQNGPLYARHARRRATWAQVNSEKAGESTAHLGGGHDPLRSIEIAAAQKPASLCGRESSESWTSPSSSPCSPRRSRCRSTCRRRLGRSTASPRSLRATPLPASPMSSATKLIGACRRRTWATIAGPDAARPRVPALPSAERRVSHATPRTQDYGCTC